MTTTQCVSVLIAADLDELDRQNPIRDGAVVPHRTFDGPGFRVRQIAFDAGTVLAEHSAPAPILVQVVEGAVEFTVTGEERYKLSHGAILHVAANVPHAVTARERSRLIVTLLG